MGLLLDHYTRRGPALYGFRAFQGEAKARPGYWATSCKDGPLKRTREHPEFATSSAPPSRRRKYGLLRKTNKGDFPSMRRLSSSFFPKQHESPCDHRTRPRVA